MSFLPQVRITSKMFPYVTATQHGWKHWSAALGWTDNLKTDPACMQGRRTNTKESLSVSKLTLIASKHSDSISKLESLDLNFTTRTTSR